MSQMKLDGGFVDDPIEFHCPLCDKFISCKRDGKGNVYHRAWMFHFTYEHGKTALTYCKDEITIWLYYFMFTPDHYEEMIDSWNAKVPYPERMNL